MSSTYTGDPSNIATGDPNEITTPSDGDALNVASVNGALEWLTDAVAGLRTGQVTDDDPQIQTTTGPTAVKIIHKAALPNGQFLRTGTISSGGMFVTINAYYTGNLGAEWAADDDTFDSVIYGLTNSTEVVSYSFHGAGASPWANAGWQSYLVLAASGGVTAAAGFVKPGATITSTTKPTATPEPGARYTDDGNFAICSADAAGAFLYGKNISDVDNVGAGEYVVTLVSSVFDAAKAAVHVTANSANGTASAGFVNGTTINVYTRLATTGAKTDMGFTLTVPGK